MKGSAVAGAGDAARMGVAALVLLGAACGGSPARLDGRVLVANGVSRDVAVFRGPDFHVERRIALPGSPRGIAVEPGGARAWVTLQEDNRVLVADLATGRILQTIAVCEEPIDATFAQEHKAFVACDDGYMSVIDRRTLTRIERRIAIGFGPRTITPGPNGHLWTANRGSNDLSEIDPGTHELLERHPAAPAAYGLAFSPDHRYAYVSSKGWNAVAVLSTEDMRILGSIEVDEDPTLVVANVERIYVGSAEKDTVTVIDARTFQRIASIADVGNDPEALALSPDGRLLFVAAHASGSLTVIDTEQNAVTLRLRAGEGPVAVAVAV